MSQYNISGPGVGLPPPQRLYPTNTQYGLNAGLIPYTVGNNEITLAAGDAVAIPAGTWIIKVGPYSVLQFLDPVTGVWRGHESALSRIQVVQSDGFTRRIANLTGCPVAAVVTTVGSGYVQATTTVTPSTGNSTWQPIIGGAVTVSTISNAGGNYSMPPIAIIPAPAPGTGVAATAVAGISSGTVNTITITNQGAGYPTAPVIELLPNPADPNFASITTATATLGLTGAGQLTAVLCTNPGAATAAAPTLTVSGAGTAAAATAVWMSTVVSSTITAAGAGYLNGGATTTTGGRTAATPVWTNPAIELTDYIPRPVQAGAAAGGTLGTITSLNLYDSGLFTGTPTASVVGGVVTTVASITLGLGGKPDSSWLQPV